MIEIGFKMPTDSTAEISRRPFWNVIFRFRLFVSASQYVFFGFVVEQSAVHCRATSLFQLLYQQVNPEARVMICFLSNLLRNLFVMNFHISVVTVTHTISGYKKITICHYNL